MEPDNPLLDDFVLSLSRRQPARVCFIPTASAESLGSIARFYRALSGRCVPSDLTLFESPTLPRRPPSTAALAEFVMAQDVFHVGGGNTANLLAIWRTHGLDKLLRRAWRAGAVLSGVSAGMLCWFQGGRRCPPASLVARAVRLHSSRSGGLRRGHGDRTGSNERGRSETPCGAARAL